MSGGGGDDNHKSNVASPGLNRSSSLATGLGNLYGKGHHATNNTNNLLPRLKVPGNGTSTSLPSSPLSPSSPSSFGSSPLAVSPRMRGLMAAGGSGVPSGWTQGLTSGHTPTTSRSFGSSTSTSTPDGGESNPIPSSFSSSSLPTLAAHSPRKNLDGYSTMPMNAFVPTSSSSSASSSSSPVGSPMSRRRMTASKSARTLRREESNVGANGEGGRPGSPLKTSSDKEAAGGAGDRHSKKIVLGLGASIVSVEASASSVPPLLAHIKDLQHPAPPTSKLSSSSSTLSEPSDADLAKQRMHDEWKRRALQDFPEVRTLRERLYPLHRGVTFTHAYKPTRVRRGEEELDKAKVMQLVLQHLALNGFSSSAAAMKREGSVEDAGIPEQQKAGRQAKTSQLLSCLKDALKETEEVWDLAIADKGDSDAVDLEDQLYYIGLGEEFGDDIDEGSVWDEDLNDRDSVIYVEEKESSPSVSTSASAVGTVSQADRSIPVSMSADSLSTTKGPARPEIRASTFNRLIIVMTSADGVDPHWVKMFLMTYQSFATPEKLLSKLRERYEVPGAPEGDDDERWAEVKKTIQLRVCNVIKKWVEQSYEDFTPPMRRSLQSWIAYMAITQKNHADTLTSSLRKAMRTQDGIKAVRETPPEPVIPRNIWSQSLSLINIPPLEIARQLCLIEMEIYRRIRPPELMDQAWNKPKLKWRAPNVLQMIHQFNSLSGGFSTAVVKTVRLKKRIKLEAHLVQVVDHLRQLNNFNSMLAILAAFNTSSVHRLKFTRQELPQRSVEAFNEAEAIMKSDMSFAAYRNMLNACNPPCIPYLGVHLTDLTFIDENPNTLNSPSGKKLINMQKRKLLYNVINKLQQFQLKEYNLQPVYQIQAVIHQLRINALDEEERHKLSLLREPRNTTREEIVL